MTIADIEDGIRNWIKAVTSLGDDFVFFNDQKVNRRGSTYITVKFLSLLPRGLTDPIISNYDPTRDPGVEIELVVMAVRELTVSIQVWGAPTTGNGTAMAIANRLTVGISLPSVQALLDGNGISPFDFGPIQNLTALLGTNFDGRAAFEAKFYVRLDLSEFTTYIERADITDTSTGQVYEISEP